MKNLTDVKNFLTTHRAKIATVLTATAFLALMLRNARQIEEFMAEHNLTEEYHNWLSPNED